MTVSSISPLQRLFPKYFQIEFTGLCIVVNMQYCIDLKVKTPPAYAAGPKVWIGHSTLPLQLMRIHYLSQGGFREMLSSPRAFVVFLVEGFSLHTSGHGGGPSSIYQWMHVQYLLFSLNRTLRLLLNKSCYAALTNLRPFL